MVNRKKLYLGLAVISILAAALCSWMLVRDYMEGQKAKAHFKSLAQSVWEQDPAGGAQAQKSGTGWAGVSARGDAFGVLGVEEKMLEKQNTAGGELRVREGDGMLFGAVRLGGAFSALLDGDTSRPGELSLRASAAAVSGVFSSKAPPPVYDVLPRYRELYERNSDLAGWVRIENTMLDFPVMYTPGDGEYYLHRLFDGDGSLYGTPFLDARCSLVPRSGNLIIHGHSMDDGTMFSTLLEYQDKQYFERHELIRFDTLYEESVYEIAAVLKVNVNESAGDEYPVYDFIDGRYRHDFEVFNAYITANALYETGNRLQYGDKLITLMTCDEDRRDGRIAVVARRVV